MRVAVEVANVEGRRRLGEALEDRALIDAVAAPGARQAKQLHLPFEARQQLVLCGGEPDRLVDAGPAAAVLVRPVPRKKVVVLQALFKLCSIVKHFAVSEVRCNSGGTCRMAWRGVRGTVLWNGPIITVKRHATVARFHHSPFEHSAQGPSLNE